MSTLGDLATFQTPYMDPERITKECISAELLAFFEKYRWKQFRSSTFGTTYGNLLANVSDLFADAVHAWGLSLTHRYPDYSLEVRQLYGMRFPFKQYFGRDTLEPFILLDIMIWLKKGKTQDYPLAVLRVETVPNWRYNTDQKRDWPITMTLLLFHIPEDSAKLGRLERRQQHKFALDYPYWSLADGSQSVEVHQDTQTFMEETIHPFFLANLKK